MLFSRSHLYLFCKIKVVGNPYLLPPTSSRWHHLHLSYLDSYLCEQVRSILQGVSKYFRISSILKKKLKTNINYLLLYIIYIYPVSLCFGSSPGKSPKTLGSLQHTTTPPWNTILETLISVTLPCSTWHHLPPPTSSYLIISSWKMLLIIIMKSVGRKALKLNHRRKQTPVMPVMDLVMQPPPPTKTCNSFFSWFMLFFSLNKKMYMVYILCYFMCRYY